MILNITSCTGIGADLVREHLGDKIPVVNGAYEKEYDIDESEYPEDHIRAVKLLFKLEVQSSREININLKIPIGFDLKDLPDGARIDT